MLKLQVTLISLALMAFLACKDDEKSEDEPGIPTEEKKDDKVKSSTQPNSQTSSGKVDVSKVDSPKEDYSDGPAPEEGKDGGYEENEQSLYVAAANPPDPELNRTAFPFSVQGTQFDFRNAVGLVRFDNSPSFVKILADGTVADPGVSGMMINSVKRSPFNRLLLEGFDGSNFVYFLVEPNGTELDLASQSVINIDYQSAEFSDNGMLVFRDPVTLKLTKLNHGSFTPSVVSTYQSYNDAQISFVRGSIIKANSSYAPQGVLDYKGITFGFQNCNGGYLDIGGSKILYDDCTPNNIAWWNGSAVIKSNIDDGLYKGVARNYGGYSHSQGAFVLGQGQYGFSHADCPFDRAGILYIDTTLSKKPVGCAPSGINMPWGNGFSSQTSGDFVLTSGTDEIWVFAKNAWGRKVADSLYPSAAKIGHRRVFYTGLTPQGAYVFSMKDFISNATTPIATGGAIAQEFWPLH